MNENHIRIYATWSKNNRTDTENAAVQILCTVLRHTFVAMKPVRMNSNLFYTLSEFLLCFRHFFIFGSRCLVKSPLVHHLKYLVLNAVFLFQNFQKGISNIVVNTFTRKSVKTFCGGFLGRQTVSQDFFVCKNRCKK